MSGGSLVQATACILRRDPCGIRVSLTGQTARWFFTLCKILIVMQRSCELAKKPNRSAPPSPCVQKASFGSVRGSSIGTWPFMSQWFVDTWHRAVDRYAASCVEAWHQRRYFLKCCLGSRANQIHKYMQVVQYIKLQDSVHRQLLVVVCARVS